MDLKDQKIKAHSETFRITGETPKLFYMVSVLCNRIRDYEELKAKLEKETKSSSSSSPSSSSSVPSCGKAKKGKTRPLTSLPPLVEPEEEGSADPLESDPKSVLIANAHGGRTRTLGAILGDIMGFGDDNDISAAW